MRAVFLVAQRDGITAFLGLYTKKINLKIIGHLFCPLRKYC